MFHGCSGVRIIINPAFLFFSLSLFGSSVQAEVEGQKITWLTPHALQQVVPEDVDYNVMLTFLEFYEVIVY